MTRTAGSTGFLWMRFLVCRKRSRIVPLVTVTEGIRSIGTHRNATIEPVSFVDEDFNTRRLWKTVEGFIEKKYDMDVLEKIVLHGDGGNWIRNGLEDFCNVVHVMDGFHFQKALRSLAFCFPKRRVKMMIMDAVKKNDQNKVDRCMQELLDDASDAADSSRNHLEICQQKLPLHLDTIFIESLIDTDRLKCNNKRYVCAADA